MERYSTEEVVVLMHHLNIPTLDPLTNPSTQARAKFCDVTGTPYYAVDGEMSVGGGGREEAQGFYNSLNARIEKQLEEPPGARLVLQASRHGAVIKVKAIVDQVTGKTDEPELHIALIEDGLTYSGENGQRFHPRVVRRLAGSEGRGFAVDPSRDTVVEHSFDLGMIERELKAFMDDLEREREITLPPYQRKHGIDAGKLSVAAFVQDAASRKVLQSAFVDVR